MGSWIARDPVGTERESGTVNAYASPELRDRFLHALDADNRSLSVELARNLTSCANPLPGLTCGELGLPIGSTYASAASRILSLYTAAP